MKETHVLREGEGRRARLKPRTSAVEKKICVEERGLTVEINPPEKRVRI